MKSFLKRIVISIITLGFSELMSWLKKKKKPSK